MQRDGGKRLVLFTHLNVLFCLERLVQAFGETAAFHNAAGEFIDDLDFAVHHNIIFVAMEQELGAQRLLQMVCQTTGIICVNVFDAQHVLNARQTRFGGGNGALCLVHLEIFVLDQRRHHARELLVRVRRLSAHAGNDKRRTRFVDQDGVHFVHHGKRMAALHAIIGARHHVVTQVVETEFRVRTIRHIGFVRGNALRGRHASLDQAHFHTHETVDAAHPLAVAAGQVVVDGNNVDVFTGKSVQITGKRGDKRFTFAGFHFGNLPFVQSHATNKLHIEVAHARCANACLAHGGESFWQQIIKRLARG